MSSKKVEDVHTTLLNKLLSESGLECLRSAPESLVSSEEEEKTEEEGEVENEEESAKEELPEEEEAEPQIEQLGEEIPFSFPTPSLRRVLPERVRKIEQQNRIHVLPESFNTRIDPALIPKINSTAQQKYIDILAELVGCSKYTSSLAEYWLLDTLANLLRRAQEDELHRPTQAILILWFCEWIKEMQHFDAADRERMIRRWKDNMLTAAKFIAEENFLPTPEECGVYYKASEISPESRMTTAISTIASKHAEGKSKHNVEFSGTEYECSLRDLSKISHYIYDLFSTDYQYDLIRSIFCFSPEYHPIDPPFQIRVPKRIYTVLKAKPKPKSPKKEQKGKSKGKKEPDTEEYLMLMQLKAKDMKEFEEQEERDREDWNRRSHILPLGFAATEEFFNLYWPPPPPEPIVEIVMPPEPKGRDRKGKGKK